MRVVIGSIFVAAVCFSNHSAAASECALKVAEYVKRAEALFEQDRSKSVREIQLYSDFSRQTPVFKSCSLQEVKEEISKSKYFGADGISWQEQPDVWTFELSDGIVGVGFGYFAKQQVSKFHYARWKKK
jgi:hypothetical protein